MSSLLRCSIHCDSAWTTLRLHGNALNMYETKQLRKYLLGNYYVPCTMLGTVRYVTEVHNSTLILRSAQQSNCEMTPTKKDENGNNSGVEGVEGLTIQKQGQSEGRPREADHV